CKDVTETLFVRDTRRLMWELRHFEPIEMSDLPESPASCRASLVDMKARISLATPNPKGSNRWPIGRAIGMCARPLTTHALDDDIMRGNRPQPKGWEMSNTLELTDVLDIDEGEI